MPKLTLAAIAALLAFWPMASARAALITVASEERIDDGVITANGELINKRASEATLVIYDWADRNGDGVKNDPVSAGLDLNSKTLTNRGNADQAANHLTLDLNGGNITDTGGAGVIRTTSNANHAATPYLTITNAASITASKITTNVTGTDWAGGIWITQTGSLNVGELSASPASALTSRSTNGIKLSGNGTGTANIATLNAASGELSTYGVDIQNYLGVNVSTAFTATSGMNYANPADVRIANIGSGGVTLPAVDLATTSTYGSHAGADLTVSTLGNITINGNVNTSHAGTGSGSLGGSVSLTAGEAITVKGVFNANCSRGDGLITLTTTTAAGEMPSIVLGDINAQTQAVLDLALVSAIQFNPANGRSVILQTITNFTGEGSTQFVSAGVVYYDDLANAALLAGGLDGVYNIAGGGTLEPLSKMTPTPEPTTVALLGLGGLATAAGAARRRRRR